MQLEVPLSREEGRPADREVDIEVIIGKRVLHFEVKTHMNRIDISGSVRRQFTKDIINHIGNKWRNLYYLYSPNVRNQLKQVERAILKTLDDDTVKKALRQAGLDVKQAREILTDRLKEGMVGTYEWFNP
ncbi:MAG TPA: hypothetical protein VF172_13600 [Nitrososphaera sp.]|jgi:hypothetical protein